MLVFSQSLSQSLSRAIAQAEQQGYGVATPEHVLLALLDDPDAIPVMRACNVDLEKLRGDVLASMPHSDYSPDPDEWDETLDSDESDEAPEGIPIEHFQVALELAVDHAKTSGREEVDSADVLVALLQRPVGDILRAHGLTRYDATTFISHGISKDVQATSHAGGLVDQPDLHPPSAEPTDSPIFKVQLLNDNYTPMDFVVQVLTEIFGLEPDDAERVMLETHDEGAGTCGTFTREEAEAKAALVLDLARQHQHPLRCRIQP